MSYVLPVTFEIDLQRLLKAARQVWMGLRVACSEKMRMAKAAGWLTVLAIIGAAPAWAQQPGSEAASGEASLKVPDLSQVSFLGTDGHKLLMIGILFCVFGLLFGLVTYSRLKNLPVHRSMREMSELI